MAQVHILTGPARSPREENINTLWLKHRHTALLIVPTQRYAQQRLRQILRQGSLPGVWGRPVLTFPDLVNGILAETGGDTRSVSPLSNALYLEAAIQAALAENHHPELLQALETPGMQRHLLNVIAQLKQAAIDPAEFQARIKKPSPTDKLVAAVYTHYQTALHERGEYDQQGLYWAARELADTHKPNFFETIDSLFLDGFDDFTPSELNLLTALEPHLKFMTFGLPYDTSPLREDAYQRVHTTVKTLEKLFNTIHPDSETVAPATQCQFINEHLFWRDQPADPPAALREDLTLIQCHNPTHEVETVGRAIKTLLLDGVPPTSIAVTARSLTPYAATLRDTFDEFGLPLTIEKRGLFESRTAQDILQIYTAFDTWDRAEMLTLLDRPWFPMPDDTAPQLRSIAQTVALEARIIRGKRTWLKRLEQLDIRLEADTYLQKRCARIPQFQEAIVFLRHQIEKITHFETNLPSKATPSDHLAGLRAFFNQSGISEYFEKTDDDTLPPEEFLAWNGIQAALNELDTKYADDAPKTISRSDFAAVLRKAFQLVPWEYDTPNDGVHVLDLESMRHLSFDHVFFLGVNEGMVPARPNANALYSEQDREQFEKLGIPFERKHVHLQREYLLFLRVFNNARQRLTLSWHALSASDQESRPSLFIDYIRELIPADRLHTLAPDTHLDTLVPDPGSIASWRDAANHAFAQRIKTQLPKSLPFHHVQPVAQLEQDRYGYNAFGPYDGALTHPQIHAELETRYNADHLYSVSQLERYIECPYSFFLAQILHIQTTESPEEQISPMLRGQILHDVLETFHKHFRDQAATEIPTTEAHEILQSTLDTTLRREAARNPHIPKGVWRAEGLRQIRTLKRYLEIEREKSGDTWRPAHFEVSFGTDTRETSDPLSTPKPYLLELDEESILLQGRIDRIDLTQLNSIRLVDYKTGQPPTQTEMAQGRSLQLTLYALASESLLLPGTPCDEALFIQIGSAKNRPEALCKEPKTKKQVPWEDRVLAAKKSVQTALHGIRAAQFHPTTHKESCKGCPNENMCRYEKSRVERKPAP